MVKRIAVNIEGAERVWYVGQTCVRFGVRIGQHLAAMLAGEYTTYDATALARGEYRRVGKAGTSLWPETLPAFLEEQEAPRGRSEELSYTWSSRAGSRPIRQAVTPPVVE